MVGTCASRTTASIKPAPPRGMTTSTRPRAWIRCVTLARSSLGSSCTASRLEPLAGQRGAQRVHQRRVGVHRRRTATQQHGIAGLERQPERVDGDVGPALVDDSDHAERNPLLAQLRPLGRVRPRSTSPIGIGQACHLSQPVRRCRRRAGGSARAGPASRPACLPRGRRRGPRRWPQGSRACGRARASAAACSARSLVSVLSVASVRAAPRARRAASWTCWRKSATDGACRLINPAYRTPPVRSTRVR